MNYIITLCLVINLAYIGLYGSIVYNRKNLNDMPIELSGELLIFCIVMHILVLVLTGLSLSI